MKPKNRRPVSENEAQSMFHLFKAGWSYQRIAEQTGRNVSTVGWIVRKLDLEEEVRQLADDARAELAKLMGETPGAEGGRS